jgi:hypothetical protein
MATMPGTLAKADQAWRKGRGASERKGEHSVTVAARHWEAVRCDRATGWLAETAIGMTARLSLPAPGLHVPPPTKYRWTSIK